MNNKILIGSMLVFTMLLLMPSIPAIQQKTIEDELDIRENELLGKLQDLDIEKIKDLLNKKSLDYTPLYLTLLIYAIYEIRFMRGYFLFSISVEGDEFSVRFIHPILALRGAWLALTGFYWIWFWEYIYDYMGWDFPSPF